MQIKGKAHCFFEQSGTFKNEFIKLGVPAEDYDIQDNFWETDHIVDLFGEIEKAYRGGVSLFDTISKDDFIMAFFPCIYFESCQMMYFSLNNKNNMKASECERIDDALERLQKRTKFHELLYKLLYVCNKIGVPMVIENPYSPSGYLTGIQNFPPPTIIDKNRMTRGDYFVKPTAYWCVNFTPTNGHTYQLDKEQKRVWDCKPAKVAGLCSEERSMIHPDYARNFICDFILGIKQDIGQLDFFD